LIEWAGHRSGGVRRLFDEKSGRPGKAVIETSLVRRLKAWAAGFSDPPQGHPRIVLLVGGPGNGKTEAIEATLEEMDAALGTEGKLLQRLKVAFHPSDGTAVPRRVEVKTLDIASRSLSIQVVQDASVVDGQLPARLLLSELAEAVADQNLIYLCCVNRGVLDDALIIAHDEGHEQPKDLLEAIVQAVSLSPDAPACWPLVGYAEVAVWPMDAESLTDRLRQSPPVPASVLLEWALDETRWPKIGTCAGGPACPFCSSRKVLSGGREFDALLSMLRWFELAAGKRWAFRDLFSLASYILAGPGLVKGKLQDPCAWAARMLEADSRAVAGAKPTKESSSALFALVASQYQHALFHSWNVGAAKGLQRDIRDLGLDGDNTAMGLLYFLQSRRGNYVPAMIATLLEGFVDILDPALSSPEATVSVWGGGDKGIKLREFDARFSRSVREGLDFAREHRTLSSLERNLLARLADLDERLSSPKVRRKRPLAATRMQRLARDFSSRLFRRSAGALQAVVPDRNILEAYEKVVADTEGEGHELAEVAHQVENLLNHGDQFHVSLTTTFGQPLPPARARAVLIVGRRRVSVRDTNDEGRPRPSLCFLDIEAGPDFQPVALTYDLFQAVKELGNGVSQSSLPRSVLAMLDTTRARMAGSIVRDRGTMDRPTIHLGEATVITRQRGQFVANRRGARA
jgi:hypothetical protein